MEDDDAVPEPLGPAEHGTDDDVGVVGVIVAVIKIGPRGSVYED